MLSKFHVRARSHQWIPTRKYKARRRSPRGNMSGVLREVTGVYVLTWNHYCTQNRPNWCVLTPKALSVVVIQASGKLGWHHGFIHAPFSKALTWGKSEVGHWHPLIHAVMRSCWLLIFQEMALMICPCVARKQWEEAGGESSRQEER